MLPSRLTVSAITFVVSAGAVAFSGSLSVSRRLQDPPGPLKLHTRPTPRTGGIGVMAALAVGLALAGVSGLPGARAFLPALAAIWLIGLLDDLYSLSAYLRLAAEAAVSFFLWQGGWHVPLIQTPWLNLLATALFVMFFINAFNMLDGSDGVAAGVTGIIALGYIFPAWTTRSSFAEIVACVLLAACAGFLLSNFPPARLFLGDSGSTTLGFLVALLALDSYRSAPITAPRLLAPLLLAGLPLSDAVISILRRLSAGGSPFVGDRGHLYDLLLQRGWRPRAVAITYYFVTAIFVLCAWLCGESTPVSLTMAGLIFGSIALVARFLQSPVRTAQSHSELRVRLPG